MPTGRVILTNPVCLPSGDLLFASLMHLPSSALGNESLVWAVRALEALAHERTVARLQQELDDTSVPNSPQTRKGPPTPQTLSYDPGSVFLLEMMVGIISKTPRYIEETW